MTLFEQSAPNADAILRRSQQEIYTKSDFAESTTFRVLKTFVHRGYMSKTAIRKYRSVIHPKHIRLGYASICERLPFSAIATESLEKAEKHAGVELPVLDNDLDVETALPKAEELIAKRVDLVIEFHADQPSAAHMAHRPAEVFIPPIALLSRTLCPSMMRKSDMLLQICSIIAALLICGGPVSAQQSTPEAGSQHPDKQGVAGPNSLRRPDDPKSKVILAQALRAAESTTINPGVPWPATDALARSLPTPAKVGPPKAGRFVGIFYFLTHSEDSQPGHPEGPLNVSKILAQDPGALNKPDSTLWGHIGESHYWDEPLYGYYHSADPWVLRRHAQLLADAGIDVLIFDTTNAVSYPEVYFELLKTFQDVRQAGGRTPQIAFMVNTKAGETAEKIYQALYERGLYRDLWFNWDGKPLMICDPVDAGDELKAFFTLRAAHWPFTLTNTPYAWHWEATYPQPYGYTEDPSHPEQVSVSVAQNLRADDGKVTNMSDGTARGRSFHDGQQHISPGSVNQGYNFQEQWQRVFQLDPPFVMVTGWNEWTAGRWSAPGKPIMFVDQFNEEFSRDIEPQRGGHGDNYYYQMVANIRRYKGAPPLPEPSPATSIKLDGTFQQWQSVSPEFLPPVREALPRDFIGVGGLHYTNNTGRNDFAAFKVTHDARNIYFYVRTRDPITPRLDSNWMWLLINSDQNAATGWCGYDFVVNRTVDTNGQTWLEKNIGGWNWEKVAPVSMQVVGNEMQLAIPRKALGLESGRHGTQLDFKWADNLQHAGDVMDFYIDGEVAPEGRFNFRYETK